MGAYGVSGDKPIVIVRIADAINLSFVNKLLIGYEYLRHNGLFIDLVIRNESMEGYQQDLREALVRMTEQIVGGQEMQTGRRSYFAGFVFKDEDKTLLVAVSHVVLRSDGPSLRAQLQTEGRSRVSMSSLRSRLRLHRIACSIIVAEDEASTSFITVRADSRRTERSIRSF